MSIPALDRITLPASFVLNVACFPLLHLAFFAAVAGCRAERRRRGRALLAAVCLWGCVDDFK